MIDQHEKHLTKLDLTAKNLKKIEKFSSKIQFDVAFFDSNEITKIEHLDVFHHLIEVKENPNESNFDQKKNVAFSVVDFTKPVDRHSFTKSIKNFRKTESFAQFDRFGRT